MPAEIHKQILDYQGGDANAALELVEKFKPLIKRYAFFLHREDSFEDLQCFLLSMLKTWDTSRLSSTDDATVTRYITSTTFDAYIYLIRFEYVISQQIYALFICLHFPGGCAIMGKVSKNTGVCHEQNA